MRTYPIDPAAFRPRPGDGPAELQDILVRAAGTYFGDAELAALWLSTTNPVLGRRKPIDVCTDAAGLEACLRTLQEPERSARRPSRVVGPTA